MSSRPAITRGEATILATRATAVRNQAQFDRPGVVAEDMVCEDAQPAQTRGGCWPTVSAPQRHLHASVIIWIWSQVVA